MKSIFFNKANKIKSIWWISIFFILLALFLSPIILIAQKQSVGVPISIQALLIILVTVICQIIRKKELSEVTGRFNFQWLKQFYHGILLGCALMVLPALVLTLLGIVKWDLNEFTFASILSGFIAVVFVAIAEELLFRGFIFQMMLESFGKWPAQFLISGLFLLTHLNNPGMSGTIKLLASINIFLASLMFGLAFMKTKSLALPIGIHLMANFTQGILLGFGVSGNHEMSILKPVFTNAPEWITGGTFGLEASLSGLVILVFITLGLYLYDPKKI